MRIIYKYQSYIKVINHLLNLCYDIKVKMLCIHSQRSQTFSVPLNEHARRELIHAWLPHQPDEEKEKETGLIFVHETYHSGTLFQ